MDSVAIEPAHPRVRPNIPAHASATIATGNMSLESVNRMASMVSQPGWN
jgi:hypothetical protein